MTHAPLPSPSSTARRLAARDREFRRLRILAMVQAGWSYLDATDSFDFVDDPAAPSSAGLDVA